MLRCRHAYILNSSFSDTSLKTLKQCEAKPEEKWCKKDTRKNRKSEIVQKSGNNGTKMKKKYQNHTIRTIEENKFYCKITKLLCIFGQSFRLSPINLVDAFFALFCSFIFSSIVYWTFSVVSIILCVFHVFACLFNKMCTALLRYCCPNASVYDMILNENGWLLLYLPDYQILLKT